MGYWDRKVRFWERASKDFPSGEEGLRAVRFLRLFFEQRGYSQLFNNHPLDNRLSISFKENYLWLIQYAQKLFTASSLPGFEKNVAKRIGNQKEFFAANNEVEVALKLHLEGLPVAFTRDIQATPDLIIRTDSDTIRVEVSSLNPPDEEMRIQRFHYYIPTTMFRKDIILGGIINRILSDRKLEDILKRVNETIVRVEEVHNVETLYFPGVATIYVAPRDLSDQMPEDCRGIFTFRGPPDRPIAEKIQRKINEKKEQLFGYDEPVILFLYTHMIDRQTLFELFKHEMDEIAVILATYPKLPGLILTVPHLRIEVPSAIKSDSLQKEFKDNKVFLESEAGVYQYESSIIWKNPHADHSFPIEVQHALETYPSNMTNLAHLPITESY